MASDNANNTKDIMMSRVKDVDHNAFNCCTDKAFEESYRDYLEYEVSQWIWRIFGPLLIILGTFGNSSSVIIFSRKRMRKSNISTHLIILAFTDMAVLYSGLLRHWIREVFDVDIRYLGVNWCKLHTFIVYFSLDFSVWTVVALTIERTVHIWFPHCARVRCTRKVGIVASAVTFTFLACINSHFFFGLGSFGQNARNGTACYPVYEYYQEFVLSTWPWVDLCVFFLVPFFILITGNLSIIYKVLTSRRAVNKIVPLATAGNAIPTGSTPEKVSQMTTMLLTLNFVLLFTTSPISIYLIGESYWSSNDPKSVARSRLAWACVNVLQYSNNALNFFLYCLSGSRFREEFSSVLRKTKAKAKTSEKELPNYRVTTGTSINLNGHLASDRRRIFAQASPQAGTESIELNALPNHPTSDTP